MREQSNYSEKSFHVPSQRVVIPSPRSMLSRDERGPLETWNCLNHRETFLAIHALCSIITDILSRNCSLYDSKCYKCGSSAERQQTSEFQFDKFPRLQRFYVGRQDSKPKHYLFRFSLGCYVLDQRSGDGRLSGCIKIISSLLDARIASAMNKIIQNFLLKKEGQSGGTESSERGSVS